MTGLDERVATNLVSALLKNGFLASDTAYGALVPERTGTPERVHTSTRDTAEFLRLALGVLAGDGSLVLTRGEPTEEVLTSRLASEGVTRQS